MNYKKVLENFVSVSKEKDTLEEKLYPKIYDVISEQYGVMPVGYVANMRFVNEFVNLKDVDYDGYISITFDYPLIMPENFKVPIELICEKD